jgi:predicted Zn-dependent peptidase
LSFGGTLKSVGKLSRPPSGKLQTSYRKTILPNGIRVISEEISHVRSISVGIWVDVGSRDEVESNNGIAHFIEHMVFKGTKKRSLRDIARSLESIGGYLNAFTGKEHTCFYARVLDEFAPLAVDVLTDMVLHATFPEKELEKEKGVVIEELKNAEDDPDDIIHDYFEKAIFGAHPMGFPVIGTEKNLRAFHRQDLTAYMSGKYVPERTIVAAAGNLSHDALIALVRKFYDSRTGGRDGSSPVRTKPKQQKTEDTEYRKPIQQAHVCLGTVGLSIKHRQRYPLMLLNSLLGDGMSSRLFQNIREKYGFAYNVYSFANMLSDTGTFGAYIGTDESHISNSVELIWKEFKKVADRGVTKAELDRTKSQVKGGMMRLGTSEIYFGEFKPMESIIRRVDAVTLDDVNEVAEELLKRERYSTVIFRPKQG